MHSLPSDVCDDLSTYIEGVVVSIGVGKVTSLDSKSLETASGSACAVVGDSCGSGR